MTPTEMERRRHGDVTLRIDTLPDGQEVFWLMNGITAMQLREEDMTSVYHVIRENVKHRWNDPLSAPVIVAALIVGALASFVTTLIMQGV